MSYNASNYNAQGGAEAVIGGALTLSGAINVATGGKITKAGTQASHIADIGNEATGTQIATAVNAILKALEDVGILKSS